MSVFRSTIYDDNGKQRKTTIHREADRQRQRRTDRDRQTEKLASFLHLLIFR